jgi:hypothetical protein
MKEIITHSLFRLALIGAALVIALAISGGAQADQRTNGYMRQNGAYVNPYLRSNPNGTTFDNYSTRGNVNPYTGNRGYTSPYRGYRAPSIRRFGRFR